MGASNSVYYKQQHVPGGTPARDIIKKHHVKKEYKLDKVILGSGGFATVRLAKGKTTKSDVAVKGIKLDEGEGFSEVEILHFLGQHEHITAMIDAFSVGLNVWIVLELYDGGDIVDFFQTHPLTEESACQAFKGVLQALEFCHSRNIAHRDVKPDNILVKGVTHPHVKLCDFGSAVHFHDHSHMREDTVGTASYVAPEVIRKCYKPAQADMWSAGMTLFCLLAGNPAYDGPYDELTMHRVLTDKLVLPLSITKNFSKACQNFLMNLVRRKVEHRMTATEALQHPWMKAGGQEPPEMVVPAAEEPEAGFIAVV